MVIIPQFLCLFFFLLHSQVICSPSFSSFPSSPSSSSAQQCPPDQSYALLQFKNTFSIDSFASSHCDEYSGIKSYPKTVTRKAGTDCCSWAGIACDSVTGDVIGLDLSCSWLYGTIHSNSSLFFLHHLQRLNLAYNNFSNSQIPFAFSRLVSLTHLNLAETQFSGRVPHEISHLSKLVSLDLSYNIQLRLEPCSFNLLSRNLTELRELLLDNVNTSLVEPKSFMNLSSSLTHLSLNYCKLRGEFPDNIFLLPELQELSLSFNIRLAGHFPNFNSSSPIRFLDLSYTRFSGELPDSIGNLKSLEYLDLTFCYFTGSIPASFWNLTHIISLNFSFNNFTGQVPISLSNLKQLTDLDLSSNYFSGPIPDVFGDTSKLASLSLRDNNFRGQLPSSVFSLKQLLYLDFSNNQLEGPIPSQASGLSNLTILDLSDNSLNGTTPSWFYSLPSSENLYLSNNQLAGHIDEFRSKSLKRIHLENNEIRGHIPRLLFQLENLTDLILSSNNSSGILELDMFSGLKHLVGLDLSYNSLLSISSNSNVNYTLPMLKHLQLSSCNIKEFPNFLRALENLHDLDLSNNNIHGQIPNWVWEVGKDSLAYLNLSHNFLTSTIKQLPWKNLIVLDLHSNLLEGPLPLLLPLSTSLFSISNNKIFGEIPVSICHASILQVLDLSNNSLSGIIPQCLGNFGYDLAVLDLRKNNLNGTIPGTFGKGNSLRNLDLNGNKLEGPLLHSLVNCKMLEVLDLGNNRIKDTFPTWLETLSELHVLVLRSNRFHGPISEPHTRSPFPKLRIIDISHNKFTGLLPTNYFKCLKAMTNLDDKMVGYMGDPNYHDYVTVTIKGLDIELVRILTIFTTIDFSNNRFIGEMPEVIGELKGLRCLNFSHNSLTGHIPPPLGNLANLEWLDLSSNILSGKIPWQLLELTSLAFLNLSHNQLVGLIPQGKQFNTFTNDFYAGKLGLCGFPLSKTCSDDTPPPSTFQQEEDSSFIWKVAFLGVWMWHGIWIGY